jgi:hypothetical protein
MVKTPPRKREFICNARLNSSKNLIVSAAAITKRLEETMAASVGNLTKELLGNY